ncbi:hypothetical protein BA723_09265 [Helicobacter sp. CLO-3]|uniref:Kae1-like domain-containing protein n=1 Tax=Helicobacter sp. CLO-3 TaxID=211 RepID=UPI000805DCC4|nr:Sua5/YciO/YrdC/YwlC family protein [Helicobacter sp. CLO-3]OBV28472.1 hypothetical protein BA723_09265 [Helicobacter sp. CLO-3]
MLAIVFRGIVQGVGFRPCIYRIAKSLGVKGGVCNINGDGLLIASVSWGWDLRDLHGGFGVDFGKAESRGLDSGVVDSHDLDSGARESSTKTAKIAKIARFVKFAPIVFAPKSARGAVMNAARLDSGREFGALISAIFAELPHLARIDMIEICPLENFALKTLKNLPPESSQHSSAESNQTQNAESSSSKKADSSAESASATHTTSAASTPQSLPLYLRDFLQDKAQGKTQTKRPNDDFVIFDSLELRGALESIDSSDFGDTSDFTSQSDKTAKAQTSAHPNITLDSALPLDSAVCRDCLRDIFTPTSRHYLYHLTTCTNCGARYSIIGDLPYDRVRTAMRDFAMCAHCAAEYANPASRFYHAQPISCNECAVELRLIDAAAPSDEGRIIARDKDALESTATLIKSGEIVCIKGLGGFALVCDASNEAAIMELRACKARAQKPFAIMCASMEQALEIAVLNDAEKAALSAPGAPIVLAMQRENLSDDVLTSASVSKNAATKAQKNSEQNSQNPLHAPSAPKICAHAIAPNLRTIGILLANTPLHHILLKKLNAPIIYTSANIHSEPIITHGAQAAGLSHIARFVLDFERAIYHGIDDSIVRYIDGKIRPLRLARGFAPKRVSLGIFGAQGDASVLALGAQDKVSPCLAQKSSFLITPYIGDMKNLATHSRYVENLAFFARLYHFTPSVVVSDMHPRYETTRLAREIASGAQNATHTTHTTPKHIQIYHHHAHLCAILAEIAQSADDEILGIIWDGSGLGEDGSVWGGEFLYGGFARARRVGALQPFALLGGEAAIKDIARIAYVLALRAKHEAAIAHYEAALPKVLQIIARKSLSQAPESSAGASGKSAGVSDKNAFAGDKNMFVPLTSSIGRLIDGVAHLLGALTHTSYEGEAGALLESLAFEFALENARHSGGEKADSAELDSESLDSRGDARDFTNFAESKILDSSDLDSKSGARESGDLDSASVAGASDLDSAESIWRAIGMHKPYTYHITSGDNHKTIPHKIILWEALIHELCEDIFQSARPENQQKEQLKSRQNISHNASQNDCQKNCQSASQNDPQSADKKTLTDKNTLQISLPSAQMGRIAHRFLYTLACIALDFALDFRAGLDARARARFRVGFSGGVFQNKALCEMIGALFRQNGVPYAFHHIAPTNDSGISLGQVAHASALNLQSLEAKL